MERKAPNFILILDALILAVVLGVLFLMRPEQPEVLEITAATETSAVPEETTATTETTPETTQTEPPEQRYTISFAGDCTLGNGRGDYGSAGSFMAVVGEDYDYPFANVVDIFSADDLTLVNFEGTLTNSTGAVDKDFNFHGPPEYAQILTAGSIEWVNLSNNHSYDYGWTGYTDTRNALDGAGIAYAGSDETSLLTLEGGLTVGIYANRFNASAAELKAGITSLKDAGADIIIVSMHWGEERRYTPTYDQTYSGRLAIDYGADVVFGHHPHVLQPIEEYEGGYIFYSMANFSFGGNKYPTDKDTAIIQLEVIQTREGGVSLGELTIIPCSVSSVEDRNDFRPTPLEPDSEGYDRVLSKLDGTYQKP